MQEHDLLTTELRFLCYLFNYSDESIQILSKLIKKSDRELQILENKIINSKRRLKILSFIDPDLRIRAKNSIVKFDNLSDMRHYFTTIYQWKAYKVVELFQMTKMDFYVELKNYSCFK